MAEYINKTDTLNEGRVKLNAAISDSNIAKGKAEQADVKSTQALANSESTQIQLDTIVIEGDSSVEAAQARVDELGEGHATLKARIDDGFERTSSQLVNITYNVTDFGVTPLASDNTQAFNDMVAKISEGSRILFPKGEYKGNFEPKKSLEIDFQGSKLVPVSNVRPILRFEGTEESPITVVGNPVYGDISFSCTDITGLGVDDIGYLVDESLRPTDSLPHKNSEIVKIRKIQGNVITVYDKIRSNQNTGAVSFIKINTIKNPSFRNVIFEVPDTHNSTICGFLKCENTDSENIKIINSTGAGVENTLCYGFNVNNVSVVKPNKIGGGEGYGIVVAKSRRGFITNIYGSHTRHIVDVDSSYEVDIDGVVEDYSYGSPVTLSHNGYGGKIKVKNISVTLDALANYGVFMSRNGLQNPDSQCFRDIRIESLNVTVLNYEDGDLINAVKIDNNFADVEILNVELILKTDLTVIPNNTAIVLMRGNQMGSLNIKRIKSEKIETAVDVTRNNDVYTVPHNTIIKELEIKELRNAVWLKGVKKSLIDNINVIKTGGTNSGLFRFESIAGVNCEEIIIGENLYLPDKTIAGNTVRVISPETTAPINGFLGKYPLTNSLIGTSLSVSNGYIISDITYLRSSGYLELLTPSSEEITLNALTPIVAPMWQGQELFITINTPYYTGLRKDITIKAGSNTVYDDGSDIILKVGKTYRLVGRNRKWNITQ